MEKQKKNLGSVAFLPLIVFLVCYVGCGITFTLMGADDPFGKFPRHVALLAGCAVALLLNRSMDVKDKLNIMTTNMGNSGVMMIVLIYLMAGGFQGAAAAMGGKDSVVNLCLHVIPVTFLIPGVFLMCCFISTSIGTSMGTIAAMEPIAINVAQGAHLNVAIVGAAVIGGSYFGDNLSMISDTTISAAEGCGSEMKDKFKMNFFIALPVAIVAMILYSVVGGTGSGAIKAGSYNIIEVLPYLIVLGSCGFFDWIQAIGNGMSDMFSISMVAILVSGIIGIVREYGGVEWLVGAISGKIKNRRGAEYGIGLMSGILSAAMVNNTIAIIVTCPIAKEIGEKYKIAPKRLASLVDIFACAFISLMPHDGGMLMITALADVSPLNVLKYSFYMFGLIIATCVTIQFGLMDEKN